MRKIIFLISFFTPLISFAYQPLVSDSPITAAASSENLQQFLIIVFNWGVGIAVILSILFIIFGGVQYMTTDAMFTKEEGRRRITAAIAGLLIVLSSWLILNTINPEIFKNDLTLTPITGSGGGTIPGGGTGNPGGNPPGGGTSTTTPGGNATTTPGGGNSTTTPGTGGSAVYSTDEQVVRQALAAQGVTINKNPCTYPTQTNCTDVNGFRQSTMNAITAVNNEMGIGGFVITGGTEHGHSGGTYSHGNGYKFDVGQGSNSQDWSTIDSYFTSLTGSSSVRNNVTYSVTIPSTGQRLDIRRETSGGLHWDIKALP